MFNLISVFSRVFLLFTFKMDSFEVEIPGYYVIKTKGKEQIVKLDSKINEFLIVDIMVYMDIMRLDRKISYQRTNRRRTRKSFKKTSLETTTTILSFLFG